jgi:hypothetical protein
MKLWILRPVGYSDVFEAGAWYPWYDKAFGFVVAAETEADARQLANEDHGDEGAVWTDPAQTTCEELTADSAGIVMRDFHAA